MKWFGLPTLVWFTNTQSKLKTIIEVSEPVGRDRDMKDCKYILNVYGPSRYDPTKTAIVTQYPAAENQFAKHMTA